MKTFEIEVKKRETTGKGSSRNIRKEDNVPCVMYGGEKLHHFYAHENLFKKMIYTPEVYIIELNIEGSRHKAVVQEIQFHPVTDKIQHIDFVEVFPDKPVIVSIPVELTGSSIGVKNGGKLRLKRRSLKVKGLLEFLPDKLKIDLTTLDIGQVIKVGDLKYNNLELIDPHRSMVVSVISSRLASKGAFEEDLAAEEAEAAEAAEATEPAEGEGAE
jgi:large subunit ribosomal protein L25